MLVLSLIGRRDLLSKVEYTSSYECCSRPQGPARVRGSRQGRDLRKEGERLIIEPAQPEIPACVDVDSGAV
jgi:hypothetical protein